MVQVMYEYQVKVSPTEAKRVANNHLSNNISTGIYADSPMLIWGENPRWRLTLSLRLPLLETTEIPGTIEVDALTGKIAELSTEHLNLILDMAPTF